MINRNSATYLFDTTLRILFMQSFHCCQQQQTPNSHVLWQNSWFKPNKFAWDSICFDSSSVVALFCLHILKYIFWEIYRILSGNFLFTVYTIVRDPVIIDNVSSGHRLSAHRSPRNVRRSSCKSSRKSRQYPKYRRMQGWRVVCVEFRGLLCPGAELEGCVQQGGSDHKISGKFVFLRRRRWGKPAVVVLSKHNLTWNTVDFGGKHKV